jgi:hypothetical protein
MLYDIHLDNGRTMNGEFLKMGKVAVMGIVQSILMFIAGLKIVGIKVFLPGTNTSNFKNYNCVPIPSMFLW